MTKIRLMSDLHGEFRRGYTFPKSILKNQGEDVLVLAGDIHVGAKNVLDLICEFKEHGAKEIIYVTGNHDYYGKPIDAFWDDWYEDTRNPVAHWLENRSIKIGDTTFIGCNLWTNFRNDHFATISARDMISDFRTIKEFSPQKAAMLHEQSKSYLKAAYEAIEGKKVIVTHFLPAVECIHPKYRKESNLNKYFANDLGDWIETLQNTHWLFGHTHDSTDVLIGDTRCIANPFGYTPHGINPNFVEYYELN